MVVEIKQAVAILRAGGLVAFPTETVYGLGADASNPAAVEQIFRVKGRPSHHPLIVHIAHVDMLFSWAREIPDAALTLAAAFWPGPLTILLKKQSHVLSQVTGGQDTIGLRIPAHPIAQALLNAFGGGLAAPSANQFTHISPTTTQAVREELGTKIEMILEGGECAVGLESTIIDLSQTKPVILRPGMITQEAIANVLKQPVTMQQNTTVRVPGNHFVHYAPLTKTVLISTADLPQYLQTLSKEQLPAALLTHNRHQHKIRSDSIHVVTMSDQAERYAHDLYRKMREMDNLHYKLIIIEAVPDTLAWQAIRDRLMKACRP